MNELTKLKSKQDVKDYIISLVKLIKLSRHAEITFIDMLAKELVSYNVRNSYELEKILNSLPADYQDSILFACTVAREDGVITEERFDKIKEIIHLEFDL